MRGHIPENWTDVTYLLMAALLVAGIIALVVFSIVAEQWPGCDTPRDFEEWCRGDYDKGGFR